MDKVIEEFESLTRDPERVQRETLKRILEDNASAEYLQNLGLNGRTDPESFKACVPLVTHKELELFIYRIIDGDASPILTGKPITTMSLSSGTTQGKPKYVPWNDELFETTMQIYQTSFAFRNRTFELVWEELCSDIREGVLTSRVTVPSIRMAMSKLLKPNPELANLIHKKCMGLSNWYGLIPELFPNAKYIYGIMTGSMEPYLKKLRHYAGELPLLTADYGSSEGWIAANVNPKLPPESATYTVLPHIGYFEFIPLTQLENAKGDHTFLCIDPQPVGLTQVKVGEEYEIVMTNPAGLYRYRLGDVVKVMGFHNSTPQLKFVRRSSLLLNINIDKNTEKDLQLAVEAASKLLAEEKLEVVDFTSHVDLSKEPGHYVIFWEISGEASEEVLGECCNCLDKSFIDAGYTSSRKVNCIGALELRVVRRGTFQKILDHYLGLGTAVSQYKTPRCVGTINSKVLQILSENVVKSYLSTAFN
ncbi:GH3 family [Sesbania bispinosa]|nr:GH3 family [Sesbania bispinosa]